MFLKIGVSKKLTEENFIDSLTDLLCV